MECPKVRITCIARIVKNVGELWWQSNCLHSLAKYLWEDEELVVTLEV